MSHCFQARKVEFNKRSAIEKIFLEDVNRFLGSNEPFFRFSNQANVAKSLLDGNRDHLLTEARSEIMKQEYKADSLNTCISELQRQTHAQRLELEDAHFGYAESRREHVRLHEQLVMRHSDYKFSRHGDLKRAQELRVDEFSVQ